MSFQPCRILRVRLYHHMHRVLGRLFARGSICQYFNVVPAHLAADSRRAQLLDEPT